MRDTVFTIHFIECFCDMALPPVIDNPQWLFKVTKQQDSNPEMSLCLLGFFLGTGLKTTEICRIQVGDLISKSGELNKKFMVRGEAEREVFLVNAKLKILIQNYIEAREQDGEHPDYYNGFDAIEPFFKRKRFGEFKILAKKSASGKLSYYCPSLNNHIKKLLNHAGVDNPSVESGRRTFALKLKGQVDVPSIHKALGNRDLNTTKKLLHTDPVSMKKLAELAF